MHEVYRYNYSFKNPQSLEIVEKILEICLIDVREDSVFEFVCPEVEYWSYSVILNEKLYNTKKHSPSQLSCYIPSYFKIEPIWLVIIDTDDESEICRLYIQNSEDLSLA